MEKELKATVGAPGLAKRRIPAFISAAAALLVASSAFWGAGVTSAAGPQGNGNGNGNGNIQTPNSPQHFQDVPPGSTFYDFVQAIADAGIAAGYPCNPGGPTDPCVPPGNLPYYHPGSNVTRGQMAKFVDNGRNLPGINMNGGTMLTPWEIYSQATGGQNILSITNNNGQTAFKAISNAGSSKLFSASNLGGGTNNTGFEAHIFNADSVGVSAIIPGNSSLGVSSVTSGTFSSSVFATASGNSSDAVAARATGNNASHALVASTTGDSSDAVEAVSSGNGSYALNVNSSSYRGTYMTSPAGYASLFIDAPNTAARITGDVFITGTLTLNGTCVGCGPEQAMQNVGDTPIEPGDVVQVVGTGPSVVGSAPVVLVTKSGSAYSGSVVGVAGQALYVPSAETRAAYAQQEAALRDAQARRDAILSGKESDTQKAAELANISFPTTRIDDNTGQVHIDNNATAVAANAYGTFATEGTLPAVKVTAANGPIHAGDLLVSSSTPGVAMKADASKAVAGTIIGKALGNLESGTGTVPVLVTLK